MDGMTTHLATPLRAERDGLHTHMIAVRDKDDKLVCLCYSEETAALLIAMSEDAKRAKYKPPTDVDIEWVRNSLAGRHTGGPNAWWEQNRDALSFSDTIRLIVTQWEAGRNPIDKAALAAGDKP